MHFKFNVRLSCINYLLCFFFLSIGAHLDEAINHDLPGCAEGTKVKTPQGYKKIEEVKENDHVVTFDFFRLFSVSDRVREIRKHNEQEVVELVVGDKIIFVSRQQQFYSTVSKTWVLAADIKIGDKIQTFSGEASVNGIRNGNNRIAIYCLAMAKNHNYYISDNDVLVHNIAFASVLETIGSWFVKEKVATTLVYGTAAYVYNQQKQEEEQQRKIFNQFDCVGTDLAYLHNGQDLVVMLPPETTTNKKSENTIGNKPSPAPVNQNRSIDRAINSMDRIKPGHGNSVTLDVHSQATKDRIREEKIKEAAEREKYWQEKHEAERKEKLFQENLKTWPHTKTTVEQVNKGWFWNSTSRHEYYTLVNQDKYLKNRSNPKQVTKDGDLTITVEYILPEASPLARELAEEARSKALIQEVVQEVVEFVAGKKDKAIADVSLQNSEAQANEERDLSGAQAPGKPTAEDGYYPPKKWDGKKVQIQGGRLKGKAGWPDRDGKIWVPSGPKGHPLAHGGPHWDVQNLDGTGHKNVEPKIKKLSMDSSSKNNVSNDDYWSIPYEERYKNVLNEMIENHNNIDEIRARDKAAIEEFEAQMTEQEKMEFSRDTDEFISTIKTPPVENNTPDDQPKSEEVRKLENKIIELQKKDDDKSKTKTVEIELSPDAKKIFLDAIAKNNTPIFRRGTDQQLPKKG